MAIAIRKCPRCDLNYILDDSALCTVCNKEKSGKGSEEETTLLCSVCGDMAALPGQDMCKACLAEFRAMEVSSTDEEDEVIEVAELSGDAVESLSGMEAIEGLEEGLAEDDAQEEDEDEALVQEA